MRKLAVCFIALCTAAPGLAPADDKAAAFTFTTIDPPGSTATAPFGISPEGDIVGNYVASGHNHGFLLHEGTLKYPLSRFFPGTFLVFSVLRKVP